MTKLLTKVFKKASKLPDALQDELAKEFMEEIEWETRWDKTLSESQGLLDQMASKANEDYEEGKTKEMGFDEL